jgi:hypothetical protein
VKGSELHRDARSDSNERSQGAFVEGEWSFFLIDGLGRFESIGILCCCLEPNFDNIEWLAYAVVSGLEYFGGLELREG